MNPSSSLPRLAVIADRFTEPERADRVVAAVKAGARWVHLRDHSASLDRFEARARSLVDRLRDLSLHRDDRRDDVLVSVNTHVAVADAVGDGVHLGWRGASVEEARERLGADAVVGYSAHDDLDAEGDRARGVDYYFFSPVYPTPSKPDHPGTGVGSLRSFCRSAGATPVYALGGITPERVADCLKAGARGVAVLSGIMNTNAPAAATRAYVRALSNVDFGNVDFGLQSP